MAWAHRAGMTAAENRQTAPDPSRPGPTQSRRRRKRWAGTIGGIAALGLVLTQCAGGMTPAAFDPVARAKVADLDMISSANGTVEAARSVPLAVRASGTLLKLDAAVGQPVRAGDVLAEVDSATAQQEVKLRRAAVDEAQARLSGVQAGIGRTVADRVANNASIRQSEVAAAGNRSTAAIAADVEKESAALNAQLVQQADDAATSDELQLRIEEKRLDEQLVRRDAALAKRDAAQAALTAAQDRTRTATAARDVQREELTALRQRIAQLQTARDDTKRAYDNALAEDERARQTAQAALAAIDPSALFTWAKSNALIKAEAAAVAAEKNVSAAEAATIPLQAAIEKATELVARFESEQATSQGRVEATVAALEGAQQGVESANRTREQAALALERSKRAAVVARRTAAVSARRDTQSTEAARQATAQAEAATAAMRAANRAKEQEGRPADIAAAQAAHRAALISLEIAEDRLRDYIVVSPFDGVITAVGAKPGEQVTSSTPIVTLMSTSGFRVRVGYPEIDAAQIRSGNPVTVGFDALPEEAARGTVELVEPTATVVNGVSTYFVRVLLDNAPDTIRVGMSATVKVLTGQRKDVVVVPLAAIGQNEDGESVVTVVLSSTEPGSPSASTEESVRPAEPESIRTAVGLASDGKPYKRRVKTVAVELGTSHDGNVEVVSGLRAGDVVELVTERSK
jgi:HlyD family secretion protein